MTVLSTESRLPGAHNSYGIEKPFFGSNWWCPKCGRVCIKGELIGSPPEVIEPIWRTPQSEKELEDRRWIMAEIGGWNRCFDNDELADRFVIAQNQLREVIRKYMTRKANGDFGDEEC